MNDQFLNQLTAILEQRKNADPATSYVASLYREGIDRIRQKIGEEATEAVIALGGANHDSIVHEIADWWFHCLVALVHRDIPPQRIFQELDRRFGLSGIEEKASRQRQ
ncbi:MAG: phosphoribosyl-ATP diphosphatase [Gammaproteobacteria bacterium]